MAEITITDKEYDRLAATVWDECQRIYYREESPGAVCFTPWTLCTSCWQRRRCVIDIGEGTAECCECRFKRRMAEEEQKMLEQRRNYFKEQLKDFADL